MSLDGVGGTLRWPLKPGPNYLQEAADSGTAVHLELSLSPAALINYERHPPSQTVPSCRNGLFPHKR